MVADKGGIIVFHHVLVYLVVYRDAHFQLHFHCAAIVLRCSVCAGERAGLRSGTMRRRR